MICKLWFKKEGWKWYYRFKKPVRIIHDSSCFNDAHSEEDCECNNFHKNLREIESLGFKEVGWCTKGGIYANENGDIIHSHYSYGR